MAGKEEHAREQSWEEPLPSASTCRAHLGCVGIRPVTRGLSPGGRNTASRGSSLGGGESVLPPPACPHLQQGPLMGPH